VELHSLIPAEHRADTVIVGVAPDPLDKLNDIVPKVKGRTNSEFTVTLLADSDHAVIDRYGLLNEQAAARGRFLPHPTTYVLDKSGTVRWKFTEVDYKIRPTNAMVLEQLNKVW
jgi:peroxiredoxin